MTDSSGNPLVEGNHPSQSILSEKVNRALQVRTDAPAMKAALDALAHLNDNDNDDNNNNDTKNNNTNESKQKELFSFDSRSVRVAIEHDALQQALKLKNELRSLVNTVQDLRQGVSETAEIARRVRAATQMQVITTETLNHMIPGSASSHHAEENAVITEQQTMSATTTTTTTTTAAATGGGLQQEVALASQLSDAFLHRDMARKRLQAVHAFLEKFDLSQEDSRLLDHYNFEDAEQNAENIANGLAFLKALDRVRHIRNALTDTFGDGGGGGGTSGDLAFLQKHEDYSMDHHQRKSLGASSALRMMEGLAQKQERAYERLYHWLQKYLHLFSTPGASNTNTNTNTATTDADAMDEALQHSFVKRAVYTLRHVPAFYSHTLELIASSRRAEETRRFLLALTSGYAGMQPIEMKAHDPVAYVGDMLAFSFKAFSVEADLAKGLLEYHPDNEEMQQDVTDREDDHDDIDKARNKDGSKLGSSDMMAMKSLEKTIAPTDMLSISMSGLARPLKSRVLQVVATLARRPDEDDADSDDDGMLHDDFEEEGTIVRSRITHLYEICGLLLFYKSAMKKGIGRLEKSSTTSTGDDDGGVDDHEAEKDVNPLIASLVDCLIETTSGYEATTRAYGAMFTQLSSVTGITEASQAQSMLSVISEVRLTSPGFSNDVNCPPQCQTILSIEWVAETLTEAALGQCSSLDDMLALRESIQAAEEAGLSSHAAVKLDKSIGEKESELVGALVEKETKKVLELCGLASVAEAWRLWQHQDVPSGETDSERIAMAAFPGLSQGSVEEGIKDFYASLYSPPLPSLDTQVKDPLLRKKARSKIAADIGELYGKLHANISSSTHGGYEDISFLIHTPEQVNTLFSA